LQLNPALNAKKTYKEGSAYGCADYKAGCDFSLYFAEKISENNT
jgi:hypothetical protein